jgi:hypothetical protein
MYKGIKNDDSIVSFIGSTVATIHVCQYAAHKVITNRIISNGLKSTKLSLIQKTKD